MTRELDGQESVTFRERMREIGFSDLMTIVAAGATKVGARRVLAIHGVSPEKLQIVFKAEAGDTPRTIADLQSGKLMNRIINNVFPTHRINEEETGVHEGIQYTWHVDPLDGTSSFAEGQRYSTVGISVYEGDAPKVAAICNPFERELLVAEAGRGAFVFPLDENLVVIGPAKRLEASGKEKLTGGIVFLDAFFNTKTTPPKMELMKLLIELSNGNLGFRMTGSNIDQQRQVASGRGLLTVTDAVGGFFDLAAGALILKEAGGVMVDGQTGESITEKTQVAIGGPKQIVAQVLPIAQECYRRYTGFK
ncbi:MAG: inositol monophosphatase family protein [bacterium]|nr:inositol monophosphatase family protein [bacterium]